ncbi:MAG: very short patch repair endonuclease [Planctomycetaceae bacterium]
MADTLTATERSRVMAAVKSCDTGPELLVRRLVHRLGYRYRLHVRALPGTPDLVFHRLGKIINVHGCFWHMHRCPHCRIPASRRTYWVAKLRRNAARDRRTQRALRRAHWRILTIWECQIAAMGVDRLRRRIAVFLAVGRPSRRKNVRRSSHHLRRCQDGAEFAAR